MYRIYVPPHPRGFFIIFDVKFCKIPQIRKKNWFSPPLSTGFSGFPRDSCGIPGNSDNPAGIPRDSLVTGFPRDSHPTPNGIPAGFLQESRDSRGIPMRDSRDSRTGIPRESRGNPGMCEILVSLICCGPILVTLYNCR